MTSNSETFWNSNARTSQISKVNRSVVKSGFRVNFSSGSRPILFRVNYESSGKQANLPTL